MIPFLTESGTRVSDPALERARRAHVIQIGTLAMFVIAAITAVRMWILGVHELVFALAVTVATCGVNLVWLRRGAPVAWCGNLGVASLYGLLICSNLTTGGFYDPNFAWFYAVPFAAAFLIDLRSGWVWTGIVAMTTIGFWHLAGMGIELPYLIPEEDRHAHALFNRVSAITGLMILAASFVAGQRRTERALALSNRELRLEAQCVQLLKHAAVAANEADDFQAAMDAFAQRALETTGWKVAFLWQPARDGTGDFECSPNASTPDAARFAQLRERSERLRVAPGELALGRVVAGAEIEWVSGGEFEPDTSPRGEAALEAGLQCAIAVPIASGGEVLAIMEFMGEERERFDKRLIEVLRDVGRQLGRVSERVRLQEGLRQSQKLESVGQLAAGIAHEINNPMAYVRANLGMLASEWNDLLHAAKEIRDDPSLAQRLSECQELIEESLEGVDRTVAIVRDVRDFAREGDASLERVNLNQLIESSLRVATASRASDVTVETALAPQLDIRCLSSQIHQVLLNLVVNAFQAMPEGGTLRIESEVKDEMAIVAIEDDGHGITPQDCERIFEPFFTNKAAGQGTGLGLYISHEIVRWHDGELEVESEPGKGTKFTLRLPLGARTPLS